MKKVFLNKKRIWIATLLIAILSVSGLSTYAYYSTHLGMLTNNITIATVTTEILEDPPTVSGSKIIKAPEVKNLGSVDCLLRVRIVISPESLDVPAIYNDIDNTKWEKVGDYYYYKGAVVPNGTTGKIFTSISGLTDTNGKFNTTQYPEIENFQITVYQEAVQSVVYSHGIKIAAMDTNGNYNPGNAEAIWNSYDTN